MHCEHRHVVGLQPAVLSFRGCQFSGQRGRQDIPAGIAGAHHAGNQFHDDLSSDVGLQVGGATAAGGPLNHQCDSSLFHLHLQRHD